jgi:hypothetical protein
MAPTRQTMARALAFEAGEFFDNLAESKKDLKPAEVFAAAVYADGIAERFRKWAAGLDAEALAKREARRANKISRYVDENGVIRMTKDRRPETWAAKPKSTPRSAATSASVNAN